MMEEAIMDLLVLTITESQCQIETSGYILAKIYQSVSLVI
jgi:hypothetical protein